MGLLIIHLRELKIKGEIVKRLKIILSRMFKAKVIIFNFIVIPTFVYIIWSIGFFNQEPTLTYTYFLSFYSLGFISWILYLIIVVNKDKATLTKLDKNVYIITLDNEEYYLLRKGFNNLVLTKVQTAKSIKDIKEKDIKKIVQ